MKLTKNIIVLLIVLTAIPLSAQSTFSVKTITDAITNYVKKENLCESRVEITQSIKPFYFSEKGVTANISHIDNLAGNCRIDLSFMLDDKVINTQQVRLNVVLLVEVPVSTRFIPKDQPIQVGDIEIQKSDVTMINPDWVVDLENAIGKLSRNGIPKGKVLLFSDIKGSSDISIKKNDKVRLIHYSGGILIKGEGVAQESGTVGSVIKVRFGNQTLFGFVADDGNVVIEDRSKLTTASK